MGAQLDRLRYEVFQNLFCSPINTGFLRPAVATALTVYGIETNKIVDEFYTDCVATALTVYGIETPLLCYFKTIKFLVSLQQHLPFTVLKRGKRTTYASPCCVATALTVYGIETNMKATEAMLNSIGCNSTYRLRY